MADRLKIGIVFDDSLDSNDGVQQYVHTIGRYLIEHGHSVRFLVGQTSNAGDLQPFVYSMSRNIRVRGNQNKMFLPFYARTADILAVLKKEQFDVLHVMTPYNPVMGERVVRNAGDVALVSHFHMVGGTGLIRMGSKLLSFVQRRSLRSFDEYLGVSSATQEYAKRYFNVSLKVSPNPIDIARFAAGRDKPFLRGQRGTIVYVGRLVERKGARYLLEAAHELLRRQQIDGLRFNICGDGELRAELETYVIEHGLGDYVLFHGYIDENEKPDFLASADLAIFPSTGGEAFGIVLTEAMASGGPLVLAGDNSGYRTVLGQRPDQLFDPHDTVLLADKIHHFLGNSALLSEAKEWQTKEVQKYDIHRVGEQVLEHYRTAIKHRRAR